MTNPFKKYSDGTYVGHIHNQIKALNIGENKKIDMGDQSITACRTALAYVSTKYSLAFKTRTDEKGNLWVKRTA